MNNVRILAMLALGSLFSLAACEKRAETTPARTEAKAPTPIPAADNTARNKGDALPGVKTPIDQSEAGADIKITAAIRRAIMDDKAMSLNAQNCKIITDKAGVVTLRGVVDSQAEKDSIDAKAKAVAGVTRVDNQLEIKAG